MADYAGAASAVYDPQQQAEQATLANGYKSNQAALTNEQRLIDPSASGYNKLLDQYSVATNGAKTALDTSNATAENIMSRHGIYSSGLLNNAVGLNAKTYQDKVDTLQATRANKLTDLASRRTALTGTYNTQNGALGSKYQGMKAAYMQKLQGADAANAAKLQAASYRASSKGPSAAETKQSFNNDLYAALDYAKSNPGAVKQGYRETVAATLAKNYGLSSAEVNKEVGQVFSSGWEDRYLGNKFDYSKE